MQACSCSALQPTIGCCQQEEQTESSARGAFENDADDERYGMAGVWCKAQTWLSVCMTLCALAKRVLYIVRRGHGLDRVAQHPIPPWPPWPWLRDCVQHTLLAPVACIARLHRLPGFPTCPSELQCALPSVKEGALHGSHSPKLFCTTICNRTRMQICRQLCCKTMDGMCYSTKCPWCA